MPMLPVSATNLCNNHLFLEDNHNADFLQKLVCAWHASATGTLPLAASAVSAAAAV